MGGYCFGNVTLDVSNRIMKTNQMLKMEGGCVGGEEERSQGTEEQRDVRPALSTEA